MEVSWIMYGFIWIILLCDFTENVVINGSNLRSFSCFGVNSTEQHCRVLGRAVIIPERLLDIYKNQKTRIRNALDSGDLFSLTGQDLLSIHPALILLIPSSELSEIGGDKLGLLLSQWSNEKAIVRHILSAVLLNDNLTKFFKRVETIQTNNDVLDMIGENLVTELNARTLGPVLPHISFSNLFNLTANRGSKMLFFFKPLINGKGQKWHLKNKLIQRIWAKLTIDCNYPMPLNQWRDNTVETMGLVLLGTKPSELSQINGHHISDKIGLLSLQFSKLQIRALFPMLYKHIHFTKQDFEDLEPILTNLLPSQLQMLPSIVTDFKNIEILPDVKSVATRNQIFEYLLVELKDIVPYGIVFMKEKDLLSFGKMATLLPMDSLMHYANKPLAFDKLLPLQSEFSSQAQVYYLLGKGKDMNVSGDAIRYCFTYLHALPASKISQEIGAKTISHLALHLPTNNLPRLIHFLYTTFSNLGSSEVMYQFIQHPERLRMFDLLPARLLISRTKKLTQLMSVLSSDLEPVHFSMPKKMASLMYRSLTKDDMNSASESESLVNNLVYGFNCQDVVDLPVPDFILTVSKLRKLLKLSNQEFPKELQQCVAEKLVDYLHLKSFVIQQTSDETLLDLLGPAEIEAVGGFVLLKLHMGLIKNSKHHKDIMKQIGQMSLSELLVAAPMTNIRELIHFYLAGNNYTVGSEEMTILGNLTMLLDENLIYNIHSAPFKLLLEGSYFDTRLCATSAQRNAWKDLILQSFGSPTLWTGEEMVILGDMMITLPNEILVQISEEAWVSVADILETRYLDPVQHYEATSFFEMCESMLPETDADSYVSSIKTMIQFFLTAAQSQLDTVISSETILKTLEEKNDYTHKASGNVLDVTESYSVVTARDASNNKIENGNNYNFDDSYTADTTSSIELLDETHYDSTTALIKEESYKHYNESYGSNDDMYTGTTEVFESYSIATTPKMSNEKENNEDDPCNNEALSVNCNGESEEKITLEEVTSSAPLQTETDFNGSVTEISTIITEMISTTGSKYRSESDEMEENKVFSDLDKDQVDVYQPLTLPFKTRHIPEKVKLLDMLQDEPPVFNSLSEALKASLNKKNLDTFKSYDEQPQYDMLIQTTGKDEESVEKEIVYESLFHAIQAFEASLVKEHHNSQDSDILIPLRNSHHKSERIVNKRSLTNIQTVSCDAIRTVGRPAELVITEDIINNLSDEEIKDCTETFSAMKLPEHIQTLIWSRIDKEDIHLKGQLAAAAQVNDVHGIDFNMSHPWVLETIYTLSEFNSNHLVGKKIVNYATKKIKHLQTEEIASLGNLICLIPDLKKHLSPLLLLRSSVVLGSSLKCNQSCLDTIANVAISDQAFGNPSTWSSFDVEDLGIIVAGLSNKDWKILIQNNSNALYGLQRSAGACMKEAFVQEIPVNIIKKIPHFTRLSIVKRNLKWSTPEMKSMFLQLEDVTLNDTETSPSSSNKLQSPNLILIYVSIISLTFTVL